MNEYRSSGYAVKIRGQTSVSYPVAHGYTVRRTAGAEDELYAPYLMHHGIDGMHWGERRFVDKQGHLTAEGKVRLRAKNWGNDPPKGGSKSGKSDASKKSGTNVKKTSVKTSKSDRVKSDSRTGKTANSRADNEKDARRAARRRKLLIAAGTAAVAGLAAYGAYKGLGKLKDKQIKMILETRKNMLMPTTAKDWDDDDRKKYNELLDRHTRERVNETTRGSVLRDTLRIQRREDVLRDRRRGHEVANLYNHANSKGELNRHIREAEKNVEAAKKKLASGPNMSSTLSKDRAETYNATNRRMWQEQLQKSEDALEALKKRKKELAAKGYRAY